MTVRRAATRRLVWAVFLGPAMLLVALLLPTPAASAHPLDVYIQATYLTLTPSSITVEMDLSPGVLVAPRVLPDLDTDADQRVSTVEARAYLGRVVRQAEIRVDGVSLPLTLTKVDMPPYLTIKAGYGTLRVFATARSAARSTALSRVGQHRVFFRNGFSDDKAAYQVNAFVAKGSPVVLGTQHRDPTQRQATISYRVAASGAVAPASAPADDGAARRSTRWTGLAGYLEAPALSTSVVLLGFGAAVLLGALHALTPGHAKTLIAAYLVGSGGTVRNAVTLGAVVTFTHTASVILIGLVALVASQLLVPGILVPALEGVSGLLVVGLGLRLLRQRWPQRATVARAGSPRLVFSGASRGNEHGLEHEHDHDHGGRPHTHALPPEGLAPRGLLAMGVSGGLVPCPEALGVMVLAVGLNRTVLGLGLIVSFSVGLAAVLVGLGLVLVKSRTVLTRMERLPSAWLTWLPLVSATVVTILGIGLLVRACGASNLF